MKFNVKMQIQCKNSNTIWRCNFYRNADKKYTRQRCNIIFCKTSVHCTKTTHFNVKQWKYNSIWCKYNYITVQIQLQHIANTLHYSGQRHPLYVFSSLHYSYCSCPFRWPMYGPRYCSSHEKPRWPPLLCKMRCSSCGPAAGLSHWAPDQWVVKRTLQQSNGQLEARWSLWHASSSCIWSSQ